MSNILKLADIVKIKGGKRLPKGENLQVTLNAHPYIRVRDMKGKFIPTDELEYVPDHIFPKIKNYIVNTNDVIVSIVGTIGLVSIITEKLNNASLTENCAKLSGLDRIDAEYLYYFLISEIGQAELQKVTVGAVQPKLPLYGLENVSIDWKTRTERKEIVKQLNSLDNKIQLNTQINQTLEQIAQALFKSWFVDFDPVRAKVQALSDGLSLEQAELAAMQAISGKTPEELTALSQTQPDRYAELAETAKAFPCEMMEVDGGEVPKGWELSTIGEEVETVGGATPSTKEESFWNNGKIAWTTPKDLSSATNPVLINTERKITELGLKKISSGLLPIGTVLLSSRAPVGYLALTKIPVAINQGYIAIKCNKTLSNFYMLQWCKENLEEIKSRASGTTFLEISKTTFRGISVIVPEKNILIMFNKQCESIYEMVTNHTKENQKLEKVRDLLLPRLLNGEIQL